MESNIAGAKARLWNAEQNLNRYKNLLAAEAVTRQQYDQIKRNTTHRKRLMKPWLIKNNLQIFLLQKLSLN